MKKFRILSAWLSGLIGMTLTGCGFSDVQTLVPDIAKTAVVVFAPASLLASSEVDSAMTAAHHGVSVVGISAESPTAVLGDLQKSHAHVVVFVHPTTALQQLAAKMPQMHFVWIGYSGSAPTAPNVTWVLPNVEPLASVAGYLAGGLQGYGRPVAVVLGQLPTSFNAGTVVASVYSGIHSAYSRAATAVIDAGPQTPATGTVNSYGARAYIVVGQVASQTMLNIQQSGVPFIALSTGAGSVLPGPELGRIADARFTAAALANVFSILARGGALPPQLISGTARDLTASGYRGWQGDAGVLAYQAALSRGNVAPDQFTVSAPTPASAAALGLPVPAALRPAAGAPTTGSSANHAHG